MFGEGRSVGRPSAFRVVRTRYLALMIRTALLLLGATALAASAQPTGLPASTDGGRKEAMLVNDAAVTAIFDLPELVCGEDSITPYVTLKNNGSNTLTNAVLLVSLDGNVPVQRPWNGSLLTGQTTNVPLGTLGVGNGAHTLGVASSLPNGTADSDPGNDAVGRAFLVAFPAETVTLALTLDDWGGETTWTLATDQGFAIASGGPYLNGLAGEEVVLPFCLGDGCYILTVQDVAGDGMCCSDGQGGLVVLDGDSVQVASSDGQFTDAQQVPFCITATAIEERQEASVFRLWPNPADEQLVIDAHWAERLDLMDGSGRTVGSWSLRSGDEARRLSITDVAPGLYLATCSGNGRRRTLPVLIQH